MRKVMRKVIAFVLVLSLVLCFVGCNNNQKENNLIDYSTYAGSWIAEGCSMDITLNNSEVLNISYYYPNHDGTRIASIDQSVLVSSIENNTTTLAFQDSWGTTGISVITFKEDTIQYEIKDSVRGGDWAVEDGVYNFVRDETSEEDVIEETYIEETPQYDVSKASGILASLGMTEQEFRNSCMFLTQDIDEERKKEYPHISLKELKAYPNNYIGQHFVTVPDIYDLVDIYLGEEEIKALPVLEKATTSDGLPYYKTTIDYSSGYWGLRTEDKQLIVIDIRDDTLSPNISGGNYIVPYMIFMGIQNDMPCFRMVSVDLYI